MRDNTMLILILLALICVLCGFFVAGVFYIFAIMLGFLILYHLLTTR